MDIYIEGRRGDVEATMSREMGFGRAIEDPVPFALHVHEDRLIQAVGASYIEFMGCNEMEFNQGILEAEDHWMVTSLSKTLDAQIQADPELAVYMIHEWFMPETLWLLLEGPEDRADLAFVLNSVDSVGRGPDGVWTIEGHGWRVVR